MSENTVDIDVYISSSSCNLERLRRYDTIIDNLEKRLLEASVGQNSLVDEYQMNDGQMVVRTKYKTIQQIKDGLQAIIYLRQLFVNRCQGRKISLRDVRSVNNRLRRGYGY